MSKPRKQRGARKPEYRVVARGVRRPRPDFSAITQASLDHYLRSKDCGESQ